MLKTFIRFNLCTQLMNDVMKKKTGTYIQNLEFFNVSSKATIFPRLFHKALFHHSHLTMPKTE